MQLKYPLELTADGSRFVEVETGSFREIMGSGGMVAECLPGECPWDDGYGAPSALGATDPDLAAAQLVAAVTRWEPRGEWSAEGSSLDRNLTLNLTLGDAL